MESAMKVLLTSLSGQYGGMEIRMLQEARTLMDIGYEVEIGISSFLDQARFFEAADAQGINCFTLDIPPFFELWNRRHINILKAYLVSVPFLKKKRYDLAHVFMPWTDQSASRLWVCAMAGIPTIMSIHGNFSNNANFTLFHKRILRSACPNLRGIFSVSESAKHSFKKNFAEFISIEIDVIPNFVDSQRFRPNPIQRKEIRQKLRISDDVFVLGYIGRLAARKNVGSAIEAFAEFNKTETSSHFVIVGDGPEESVLRQKALDFGLINSVHFLGFQAKPEDYFPAFDASILLSEEEGFGISVIESMSCSVPVICSNVPGLSEIVTDNHTGFLVSRNEHPIISERLAEINQDRSAGRFMGSAGREFVLKNYDFPIFKNRIRDFYQRHMP